MLGLQQKHTPGTLGLLWKRGLIHNDYIFNSLMEAKSHEAMRKSTGGWASLSLAWGLWGHPLPENKQRAQHAMCGKGPKAGGQDASLQKSSGPAQMQTRAPC